MTFRRFLVIIGVVALMNGVGWLRDAISWLDKQGGFTQTVVAALVVGAGGLLWSFTSWSARFIFSRWRQAKAAMHAQRARLMPQPKMGLVETIDTESKALKRVHESIANIQTASIEFKRRASAIQASKNASAKSRTEVDRLMGENARALNRFSDSITDDIREFKRSVQRMSDSWSSRMYWHDKRGSANDILARQLPETTRNLLTITRESIGVYSDNGSLEGLEGWNSTLDKAVHRHKQLRAQLVKALQEFETVCEQVLEFHRTRTGFTGRVNGWLARLKRRR